MVRTEVVAARLGELAHRIERIRARTPAAARSLTDDEDTLDLLSFNLMLAVQCCVDIASHLIADEGWRPAVTLGESFERLREQGVLTAATATALRQGAGLRDVVAHGYAGVDPAMVFAAASVGVANLEHFAAEVATWLRRFAAAP